MKQSEIKAGRRYTNQKGCVREVRLIDRVDGFPDYVECFDVGVSGNASNHSTIKLKSFASWAKSEVKGEGV